MRALPTLLVPLVFTLACMGGVPHAPSPEASAPEPAEPTAPGPPPEPIPEAELPAAALWDDASREDCTIADPGEWPPLLAAAQPNASAPRVERGPHGVSETVTLASGTRVRVTRGGCHHAGETWQIAPAPEGSPQQAAASILGTLAWHDADALPNLIACLSDPQPPDAAVWDCGDAHATVERRDALLELSWSFAL